MQRLFLIGAAALLAMPGLAAAQQAPALALGGEVRGELGARDPATEDGIKFDEYVITLGAGQAIVATMSSEDFDSVIEIGRGRGAQFESLATDDDGGGGSNSRLRFRAETAGPYTVRARAFAEEMTGAYTVTARERVAAPEGAPGALGLGQTVEGALADGGARTDSDDRLYRRYALTLSKGQRVMIEMTSTAFDSVVELGRGDGESFEAVASDDDSGGNSNARLITEAPEDGTYIVRALGFAPEASGDFAIKVSELPAPRPLGRPVRLESGRIVSGALALNDPAANGFKFYDLFEVRGREGESVVVSLRSKEFDSFLAAGADTVLGFATVVEDDDSGGDLDAQLTLTFTRSGSVLLRATSVADGATGSYSISVEPAAEE